MHRVEPGLYELRGGEGIVGTAETTERTLSVIDAFMAAESEVTLLMTVPRVMKVSLETRRMMANDPRITERVRRAAIVFRNPLGRILASVFMAVNKPRYPTRAFTDRDAALEWLREAA